MSEALGKKYHTRCFCCSECAEPLTGSFHMDAEGHLFCRIHWAHKKGLVCATCGQTIDGDYVTASNENHHTQCFVCTECNLPLGGKEFLKAGGKFQCASHFKCATCNGPLDSQVVSALGKKYHVGHFVCTGCKRSLVGEPFYGYNESPYCGACNDKLP